MKKIKNEVKKLEKDLLKEFGHVPLKKNYPWRTPPLNVIDCVLSLNRNYYSFVKPRVRTFADNNPNIEELKQLIDLIDNYDNPGDFSRSELNYNHDQRAETLLGVTLYLDNKQDQYVGSDEFERLKNWANSVSPDDFNRVEVKGFGLSGFQYLRMLFGAQTTKPDRYIKKYVSDVIGRKVNDVEAIELLETASGNAGLLLREVDGAIWEKSARKTSSLFKF